jgi:hypothetical protein
MRRKWRRFWAIGARLDRNSGAYPPRGERLRFSCPRGLSLFVINPHQLAVHPGLEGDGVDRGGGAEPGEADAHIPLLGRGRGYVYAWLIKGRPLPAGDLGRPAPGQLALDHDPQENGGRQPKPPVFEPVPGRVGVP